MALISLESLKTYLKVLNDAEDQYLEELKVGVEEAFRGLIGWRVEQNTYTEYYNGNWTINLPLRQVPVGSVTSVYLDPNGYGGQGTGAFPSSSLQTSGVDYYLELDRSQGGSQSGLLVRIAGVWPGILYKRRGDLTAQKLPGQGNVKVTYVAGYKPIPDDIQLALWEACKELRLARFMAGPYQGESLQDYSYSVMQPVLPATLLKIGRMEQIVMRYRRLRLQ